MGSEMPRELLGDAAPAPTLIVESASNDFSQVVPTEYRADLVLLYRDPARGLAPKLALILEVQLRIDRRKQRTWPVYVAAAAANFDCDARLMVIAPQERVAKWARGPFGPPDFRLSPTVRSFRDLARLIDRTKIERLPQLALLRAIVEPSLENALDARENMSALLPEHFDVYWDMLLSRLSTTDLELMEVMKMQSYKFRSPVYRRQFELARSEGRAEGRREGKEIGLGEGEERGLIKGEERGLIKGVATLASAALELARVKLGVASLEEAQPIRELQDPARLTALIVALGQATDAAQARAAIAATLASGATAQT